MQNQFILKKH